MKDESANPNAGEVETIFNAALAFSAAERPVYLAGACRDNLPLRQRVEALLRGHEASPGFLPEPPPPSSRPTLKLEFADSLDEAIGQTIGRYKLLERVGEGGCGVVYVAEQTHPVRRRVALKVIKLGMDTKAVVARFEAERQALAMMDHPNIAKVFDAGTTETGRPYFVMELVRGIRITDYCDQANLSTKERLDLFIKVCQAIQHAHQKGIIHRDIKPSNILVTMHDGVPVPKVIDFGIAKATEGRLTDATVYTQLHQFIGTPAYMSPEQAEMSGLDVDTRSDIYSLGVLLYELLTGRTPFDAKELVASGIDAMRKTIREKEPVRPSTRLTQEFQAAKANPRCTTGGLAVPTQEEINAEGRRRLRLKEQIARIRGDLDWIVMKCLEKDRTRRYETANGIVADVRRHLNSEPVVARPPSVAYRFQKAIRRNKLAFAAAAAVMAALLIGIGVSTWQAARAARARNREVAANGQLRNSIAETEKARQLADQAARSESEQRQRVEGMLQQMQIKKSEELFSTQQPSLAIGYLGQMLRDNPSNETAADRLTSAVLQPFSGPLTEPLRHEGVVRRAEFSPDGTRVATASYDNTARVWDARTGQPLTKPLRHKGWVFSARFSPDGSRVVTASADHTARVWDAATGVPIGAPMEHQDEVISARFSPDGSRVVTASRDKTARVWDARAGVPLTGPLQHGDRLRDARFSPDGSRVVTASNDKTARIWDATTSLLLTEPLRHQGVVTSAQFSPDGLRVVTASFDKTARVWDAITGRPLTPPLRHGNVVADAQFSPDGLRVVTASIDKTAQIWDATTGLPLLAQPLRHEGQVFDAQFSLDGLRVVTASADGTARVWDAYTGKPLTEPLRHEGMVVSAQFSPDGSRVVTASFGKTARIWDARVGGPMTEPLGHQDVVTVAEFSPDGSRVVTASLDNTARVWDARTGLALTDPLRHGDWVYSARFSPDGSRVVTASMDKTAQVWDARTGQSLGKPLRHESTVEDAQFSPDGSRIVTASRDKTARVWDALTGLALTDPLRHGDAVFSARFSPDSSRVVTASVDKTAQVWDARTGQPLGKPLTHDNAVHSAEFSPDGLRVVTASYDNTARVWDARTGQPLTEPLRHEGTVWFAQFSPDGSRIVTASQDHTARVWDARTGQPVGEPLQHEDAVYDARFSPDGSRVVTASADNTARVWDARTGRPLGEPMRHEASVETARFSPDGLWVVTVSDDKTARVWEAFPTPVPVPNWFLDWTEARVGHRFASAGEGRAVPYGEQRRQWEQAQSRADTNYYTRIAQWVQSDPATRPISPNAVLTTPEYVRRRIEENTLPSLREALLLSPDNSLAWARVALQLTKSDEGQIDTRLKEADWSAQYALKLDLNQAEAWRAAAAIQWMRNHSVEALTNLDRALALRPDAAESWELRGDILEQEQRHAEALKAYNRLIALLPATGETRFQALVKHAAVCRNLQRWSEAAADLRQLGIPPRDPAADPRLIDLSGFYNASLRGNWFGGLPDDDLAALPTGICKLAGVSFDIRGLIQLAGAQFPPTRFPAQVTGIPVDAKAAKIHFLQAVIRGNDDPPGTTIGKYVLHYADGSVVEHPLVLGKDAVDLHEASLPQGNGNVTVAWIGENPNSFAEHRTIRLYVTTWENPRPEVEITRLDFVSARRAASPFLVAVTIE